MKMENRKGRNVDDIKIEVTKLVNGEDKAAWISKEKLKKKNKADAKFFFSLILLLVAEK